MRRLLYGKTIGLTILLALFSPLAAEAFTFCSDNENKVVHEYSDEQLCNMARLYYGTLHGDAPKYIMVDGRDNDTVIIHLFNIVGNHTDTYDWFYINKYTGTGTDLLGNYIDLTAYVVVQAADTGIYANWNEAYQNFIVNGRYLTSGQDFGSDIGEDFDPVVSLYDFDGDEVPELLIDNGYSARALRCAYIYTYEEGRIWFLSNGPTDAFYIPDSEYGGVWGCYNDSEGFNWTYYCKEGSRIYSESVYEKKFNGGEYGPYGENTGIYQITGNDDLFRESQSEKTILYGQSVSSIAETGWDSFVARAGFPKYSNIFSQEITQKWSALFEESSFTYQNELALLAAQLSEAAEDTDGSKIKEFCLKEGFQDICPKNYGDSFAYCIAAMPIQPNGDNTYLLTITARGSTTGEEIWGDFVSRPKMDFWGHKAYEVVYNFEEEIWKGLNDYLNEHQYLYNGKLKVLVTGHSLGGAAANLVAARFTRYVGGGAWWSGILKAGDIYAYTFGALDSIKTAAYPAREGYDNIHNIYNFFDTFGPTDLGKFLPNGIGSIYGKFGHIDLFVHEYRGIQQFDFTHFENFTYNHNMPQYIDAVEKGYVKCKRDGARAIISCPVDVSVVYNGEIIGQIKDGKVITEAPEVPMTVIGESKYIFFQDTDGYSILLTATDTGKMEYSVEYLQEGEAIKFTDVSLKEGKIIQCEMKDSLEEIQLYVVDDKGKVIKEILTDGREKNVSRSPFIVWGIGIFLLLLMVFILVGLRRRRMTRRRR